MGIMAACPEQEVNTAPRSGPLSCHLSASQTLDFAFNFWNFAITVCSLHYELLNILLHIVNLNRFNLKGGFLKNKSQALMKNENHLL